MPTIPCPLPPAAPAVPVVSQGCIEPAGRDGLEAGPTAVLLGPARQQGGKEVLGVPSCPSPGRAGQALTSEVHRCVEPLKTHPPVPVGLSSPATAGTGQRPRHPGPGGARWQRGGDIRRGRLLPLLSPHSAGDCGEGDSLTWAARSISCSRAFFTALVIMTGEYFSSSSFSCEGRREVTQLPGPRGSHNAVTRGHPWPCLQDPHAPGLCPPGG